MDTFSSLLLVPYLFHVQNLQVHLSETLSSWKPKCGAAACVWAASLPAARGSQGPRAPLLWELGAACCRKAVKLHTDSDEPCPMSFWKMSPGFKAPFRQISCAEIAFL